MTHSPSTGKTIMNSTPQHLAMLLLLGSALALTPRTHAAQESITMSISGQCDWSIIPPEIPSEYVTFHPDGGLTIQDMPLKGNFLVTGDGVELEGLALGVLNAEIDANLNGYIQGPFTVVQLIKGKEKIAFQGEFFGTLAELRSSGQIVLQGRGHCAGLTVVVSFLETGNSSEVFTLTGDLFDRKSDYIQRVWATR
jgi:hypothetical protein